MIIAIDGPAGAGKSTVAQEVAKRLGMQLLDTGAIYRTVALAGRRNDVSWDDGPGLAHLADALHIRFVMQGDKNTTQLGGENNTWEDISAAIRAPEISQGASRTSAHPEVRASLLELQRRLGKARDSVVEGRDIGTVVFPSAKIKIFLTASPAVRAVRRRTQLLSKTSDPSTVPSLEEIEAEIAQRDDRDANRPVAPLKPAQDAVLLDSSTMSQEEVIDKIVALASAP